MDVTYSGSQKCLGSPPGAAPLSLGPRARDKLAARKSKARARRLLCRQRREGKGGGGVRLDHIRSDQI